MRLFLPAELAFLQGIFWADLRDLGFNLGNP
jgi:hypothetical protein